MEASDSSPWSRLIEVYDAACAMPAEEVGGFLDAECGDDAELRADVQRLLAARHRAAGPGKSSFMEGSPDDLVAAILAASEEAEGDPAGDDAPPPSIEGFRIVKMIGEGGMGRVYLAEQHRPERTVALKILSGSHTSPAAQRRFADEALILGRLNHQCIAQVYGVGPPPGEECDPYIIMEYVAGKDLTDEATRASLSARQKLRLIAHVCDAVHHAHQKLVIHRDIKPENILIDSSGLPKVVDFGIARLVDPDLDGAKRNTLPGSLVGSIPYMSPEQVAGEPDLDVRSDVYSIGVVMHELLAGKLPYDLDDSKSRDEKARIIREKAPARLGAVSAQYRGDVETIALKALAKEPELRYQSAAELGDDIRCYLASRPIRARLPTMTYRFRRFARRNPTVVGAAALLVVVSVVAVSAAISESRARDRAESERRLAQQHLDVAMSTFHFIDGGLFGLIHPYAESGGRQDVTVREAVDHTAAELAATEYEPLAEAAIRSSVGNLYRALGEYELAELHLAGACSLYQSELGFDSRITLRVAGQKALLHLEMDHWQEAEGELREVLDRARAVLGADDPDTLLLETNLAGLVQRRGDFDESETMYRVMLERCRQVLGENDIITLDCMNDLGTLLAITGRFGEARGLLEEALEQTRRLGTARPDVVATRVNIAAIFAQIGELQESLRLYEQLLVDAASLPRSHPYRIKIIANLGDVYLNMERFEQAAETLEQARALQLEYLGERHADALITGAQLASAYARLGRVSESVGMMRSVINDLDDGHPYFHEIHLVFGDCLVRAGRFAEAESVLLAAHSALSETRRPSFRKAIETIVELYDAWENEAEAARWRAALASDAPAGE